ncbi:hypothetical protein BH18ACI4_BH18ACI4_28530 [soil metagenome]
MKLKVMVTAPMISLWVLCGLACGQSGSTPIVMSEAIKPQRPRSVTGQVLTSTTMPAVRLEFDRNFRYVGINLLYFMTSQMPNSTSSWTPIKRDSLSDFIGFSLKATFQQIHTLTPIKRIM